MRFLKLAVIAAGMVLAGLSSSAFGQEGVQKNFGQWRVECNPKVKENPCVLAFALIHPKDKKIAFAWSIVPGKEPNTQKAVIRTLNGTRLADGITVKFAKGDPLKLAYFTCGPRFCFAEFPFSDFMAQDLQGPEGLPGVLRRGRRQGDPA